MPSLFHFASDRTSLKGILLALGPHTVAQIIGGYRAEILMVTAYFFEMVTRILMADLVAFDLFGGFLLVLSQTALESKFDVGIL